MSSTPTYDQVPYDEFCYTEPRRNQSGGYNCYINVNKNEKKSAVFQLPKCKAKFGVNDKHQESDNKRNIELSVAEEKCQTWFGGLDVQNNHLASQKSKLFFKQELSEEILSMTKQRKSLKYDDERKYDPLLRLKCITAGKGKTEVYIVSKDADGKEVCDEGTLDDITPWSDVVPIVSLGGLWANPQMYGMTIIAKALMVWPAEKKETISFTGLGVTKRQKTSTGVSEPTPAAEQPKQVSPFDEEIM